MLGMFKDKFGVYYNTSHSPIFDSYNPDGWIELNNKFYIIENKAVKSKIPQAKDQLKKYINLAIKNGKDKNNIIGIIGTGISDESFEYNFYNYNLDKIEI